MTTGKYIRVRYEVLEAQGETEAEQLENLRLHAFVGTSSVRTIEHFDKLRHYDIGTAMLVNGGVLS